MNNLDVEHMVWIGPERVRRLRTASIVIFLAGTVIAIGLFYATLALRLDASGNEPANNLALIFASGAHLALLLYSVGSLLIWRHTEAEGYLDEIGRRRLRNAGIVSTLMAGLGATGALFFTVGPLGLYGAIALPSAILTLVLLVLLRIATGRRPTAIRHAQT